MSRAWIAATYVLMLLAASEGVARLLEWARPAAEDVRFDYAPYQMLRMTSAPFPLNSEGFRAEEFEAYRGKFLVQFLGASVCLGVGSDPGMPLPERLELALHRAGMKQAAVLNLCQGGVSSAQELAIFLKHGLPLRPHVVLSFNGANDLMHPRPLGDDDGPNLPYHHREIQSLFEGHHSWIEHLAVKRVVDRLSRRLPASPAVVVEADAPGVAPDSIIKSYLYVTGVVRTLTEAQGGIYALLLQPTLHYAKPWSREESASWAVKRPRDARFASHYARGLYARARQAASSWASESGGRLFDLTETFAATNATVYSDSVHFTGDKGFRMLEEELEKQGIVEWIGERYRAWEQAQADNSHAVRSRSTMWQH